MVHSRRILAPIGVFTNRGIFKLLSVSLDIAGAVARVLGVMPKTKLLRERMVQEFPVFVIERFDARGLRARAVARSRDPFPSPSSSRAADPATRVFHAVGVRRTRVTAEARDDVSLMHLNRKFLSNVEWLDSGVGNQFYVSTIADDSRNVAFQVRVSSEGAAQQVVNVVQELATSCGS